MHVVSWKTHLGIPWVHPRTLLPPSLYRKKPLKWPSEIPPTPCESPQVQHVSLYIFFEFWIMWSISLILLGFCMFAFVSAWSLLRAFTVSIFLALSLSHILFPEARTLTQHPLSSIEIIKDVARSLIYFEVIILSHQSLLAVCNKSHNVWTLQHFMRTIILRKLRKRLATVAKFKWKKKEWWMRTVHQCSCATYCWSRKLE